MNFINILCISVMQRCRTFLIKSWKSNTEYMVRTSKFRYNRLSLFILFHISFTFSPLILLLKFSPHTYQFWRCVSNFYQTANKRIPRRENVNCVLFKNNLRRWRYQTSSNLKPLRFSIVFYIEHSSALYRSHQNK